MMEMLPENKNSLIYGAGGKVGSAFVRQFAARQLPPRTTDGDDVDPTVSLPSTPEMRRQAIHP